MATEKEKLFPGSGRIVALNSLGSGKCFPLAGKDTVRIPVNSRGIVLGASRFIFGIPIANVDMAECNGRVFFCTENMAQGIQTAAIPRKPWSVQKTDLVWGSVVLGALIAAIYYRVLGKLVTDWWEIPDFSHGFLVPIFAFYMVWMKKKSLQETKIVPSWNGVFVVALGLVVLVLGVYGAELFLSRVSLVILLSGLVLCFGGWQLLTELRFVLLVLLLAIPIPSIIFNEITLPLQILASKSASNLLPLFGVPVLREGNVIELPAMKLEVAEACSGIRSLMSLFTLAVFYGYFLEKSLLRRAILAVASIPIAIAANAVRILGTGLCVQYWDPDKALGFFHEFSGWVMFLVSLGCLFIVHRAMNLFPVRRRAA